MSDVYDPTTGQMSLVSAQEMLADYTADLLARDNLVLLLYQNNISPGSLNTLANLVEATFGGYSRFDVSSFTAQGVDSNNNVYVTSALAAFQANGNGPSNAIFGNALAGTPAGGVAATATNPGQLAGAYSTNFVITARGAAYTATPAVTLNGAGGTGATAHAVLNADGTLFEIVLDSAGTGYSSYTVEIDVPLELIKSNVLSSTGIPMNAPSNQILTYTQLIQQPGTL